MRRSPSPLGRWTAARQAWLEQLERGPAARPHNVVGYHCMQLGWTTWENLQQSNREMLTDAGRAKLAEWRAAGRQA